MQGCTDARVHRAFGHFVHFVHFVHFCIFCVLVSEHPVTSAAWPGRLRAVE